MPQIIEGQLDLAMGTGRNTFVLNPISTTYASVIVDPEECKNLTQDDIGKRYRFCQKTIKIGISEFVVAYDLKEITLQQWKDKFTHHCAIKPKNNEPIKTAMQELIEYIESNEIVYNKDLILKLKELLEKEKEQIIEAGNACGLKAIVYHQKLSEMSKDELIGEMVEDGMSHGEEYYNQTYNQNK